MGPLPLYVKGYNFYYPLILLDKTWLNTALFEYAKHIQMKTLIHIYILLTHFQNREYFIRYIHPYLDGNKNKLKYCVCNHYIHIYFYFLHPKNWASLSPNPQCQRRYSWLQETQNSSFQFFLQLSLSHSSAQFIL